MGSEMMCRVLGSCLRLASRLRSDVGLAGVRLGLFAAVAALTSVACGASAVGLGGQQVTVAVENSYPPYSYIDAATGEAGGWDYEVMAELCERLDCEPVFVPLPWDMTLAAVGGGDIDMAANGIVITPEREQIVDFADSHDSARQYLFARADEDRFTSADEMAVGGYTVAVQINTVNSAAAEELVGTDRVITFAQFPDAVAAVSDGRADAFLHLLRDGQSLTGPHSESMKIVGDVLAQLDYGFVFSDGSDLLEPFNEALAEMKADGTLAGINDRYFGPSFDADGIDFAEPVYDELPE